MVRILMATMKTGGFNRFNCTLYTNLRRKVKNSAGSMFILPTFKGKKTMSDVRPHVARGCPLNSTPFLNAWKFQPSNLVGRFGTGQLGIPSFSDLLQGGTWFSNDGPRSVSRPQWTCVSIAPWVFWKVLVTSLGCQCPSATEPLAPAIWYILPPGWLWAFWPSNPPKKKTKNRVISHVWATHSSGFI